MKWWELSIRAPGELVEPLSSLFQRYGHGGVVIEQGGGFNPEEGEAPPGDADAVVKTYIPSDHTARRRRERIALGIRLFSLIHPLPPLQEREVEEQAWEEAWKAHFPVTHVGRRLVIKPTWHQYVPRDQEVVLHLDPGMAFGTGHHPTTRLCLQALEQYLEPGMEVLDVGTGSGILALAAARLGARFVLALETDPVAARFARANVTRNDLRRRIRVLRGALPHPKATPRRFHLALVNVSGRFFQSHAHHVAHTLVPQGLLVASGFTLEHEPPAVQALDAAGFVVVQRVEEGDWVAVVARQGAFRTHPGGLRPGPQSTPPCPPGTPRRRA